jgi:hypothetical protein
MKVANITATATIHGLMTGGGSVADGIQSLTSMMPQKRGASEAVKSAGCWSAISEFVL